MFRHEYCLSPQGRYPPEATEDAIRTWTKALESLVLKLVLEEVNDAFLCSGRLWWAEPKSGSSNRNNL